MITVLLFQFTTHLSLRRYLLKTHPNIPVYCYPTSTFWGVGLSKEKKEGLDPTKWKGQNKLGYLLAKVRDEMMLEAKQSLPTWPPSLKSRRKEGKPRHVIKMWKSPEGVSRMILETKADRKKRHQNCVFLMWDRWLKIFVFSQLKCFVFLFMVFNKSVYKCCLCFQFSVQLQQKSNTLKIKESCHWVTSRNDILTSGHFLIKNRKIWREGKQNYFGTCKKQKLFLLDQNPFGEEKINLLPTSGIPIAFWGSSILNSSHSFSLTRFFCHSFWP